MRQPQTKRPLSGRIAGPLAATLAIVAVSAAGPPLVSAASAADTRVELQVVSRAGGPPLTDGVDFQIWARDGKRATRKVAEHAGAPAELTLPPDEYRVVTTYGQARRVTDIEVSPGGRLTETVNLNLGRLKLELLPGPGANPVRGNVAWTVRPYNRGGGGKGDPVARTRDAVPQLGLSAGWYKVAARHREDTYTHVVEVPAGRSVTYSLFMK